MKIIGNKVHDYYDTVNQYGYDNTGNIFVRDPTEIQSVVLPDNLKFLLEPCHLHNHARTGNKTRFEFFFIKVLVAGKMYGGVRIRYNIGSNVSIFGSEFETVFVYSFELFQEFMKAHDIEFDQQLKKSHWWTQDPMTFVNVQNYFNNIDLLEPCIDHKLVIALITPHGRGECKIEFNGELKKVEFYKCMDAFTIFQELSMYVDGCLTSPGNQMIEIEDKYKIEGHGFDTTYGFRTRKK